MNKIKKIPISSGPMRVPIRELVEFFNYLGWSAEEIKNEDYPYNTIYWILEPINGHHLKSDKMVNFLYACGREDVKVNYELQEIYVYV